MPFIERWRNERAGGPGRTQVIIMRQKNLPIKNRRKWTTKNLTVGTRRAARSPAFVKRKLLTFGCLNVSKFTLDRRPLSCYIITMETIMISPTKLASKRTKNRIVENGAIFTVERFNLTHVCLRSTETDWLGWLPRNEFHVECVGEKFIEKVLG